MKKSILILTTIIMCIFSYSKDFNNDFLEAFKNKNSEEVERILKEWEKEVPNDPEMYISYFNYYLNRSAKSTPTMGKMKDGRYGIYEDITYQDEDVKLGISYLDKALERNPNRLDIHFGKCSSLLRAEKNKEAADAIMMLLEQSKKNKNAWLWVKGITIKDYGQDGEHALFSGLNDYLTQLFYDFESNKSLLESIVEKEVNLYPKNTWGLNHAARFYSQNKNYKKAIELLQKANKEDPEDYVVAGNLAYAYECAGDYTNARIWYEKLTKIDNEDAQEYGKQGLEIIKGK